MFYVISGTIIVAGIISMASRGFNYGVDFLGGRSYVVEFTDNVNTDDVTKDLTAVFEGKVPAVKSFGADNRLKIITAYEIDNDSPEADDMVQGKLVDGLKNISSGSAKVISSQKIGPTIANDIKVSAIWAVALSLIVIFVYIWVRFRKWQFSLGAVTALFHDVLIVLSAFSLFYGILPFSLEIDQAFIAAILTVVGYSINDTVVVFDRIREYDAEHIVRKKPLAEVINDAVNSTLSRTIMTSFTTFIVLLVLFIAGGETIKGFSFALLIGIVVGTYSSIFVASPVVLEFYKNKDAAVNKA
jgi:SecD/SecF fusion protein